MFPVQAVRGGSPVAGRSVLSAGHIEMPRRWRSRIRNFTKRLTSFAKRS
jgi:hypothetical protein